MAQNSKIEWTHHTLNLWHGCTKVHEGCDNCYAEKLARRWGNDIWGADKPRKEIKKAFDDLDKFQKLAAQAGEVHRVFVGSMMDIFEKPVKLVTSNGDYMIDTIESNDIKRTNRLRDKLFFRIANNRYPNLLFLLLTKRPSNIKKYIPDEWLITPPANVMYGTSISTQANANTLIPQLIQVPGKHFLSIEPQIEIITLLGFNHGIDWVIQGGESGHHKRPFNIEWAKILSYQCNYYKIPYFFKQIDKVQPIPANMLIRQFPKI